MNSGLKTELLEVIISRYHYKRQDIELSYEMLNSIDSVVECIETSLRKDLSLIDVSREYFKTNTADQKQFLSKLEYFAIHAPEMPTKWDSDKNYEFNEPDLPKYFDEQFGQESEYEHRRYAIYYDVVRSEWTRTAIPTEFVRDVKIWRKAWEDYIFLTNLRREMHYQHKRVKWAVFYAKTLIEELEILENKP